MAGRDGRKKTTRRWLVGSRPTGRVRGWRGSTERCPDSKVQVSESMLQASALTAIAGSGAISFHAVPALPRVGLHAVTSAMVNALDNAHVESEPCKQFGLPGYSMNPRESP